MSNICSNEEIAWRKKFGDKLRRLMHIRGLTQKQVAIELGVDPTIVSRYVRGLHSPTAYKISQLAKILDCDVNRLYDVDK